MFAILKNVSQYCIVIQCSLVFSVIFVSNFCFMVKQFLYIIGLHWAALGFLAVAPLFCVVRWSRGMDVRCSSVFYCLLYKNCSPPAKQEQAAGQFCHGPFIKEVKVSLHNSVWKHGHKGAIFQRNQPFI